LRRFAALAKPEFVFIVLALPVGVFMALVNGPFQAPDENNHFFRAYQISEGKMRAVRHGDDVGGWLPSDVKAAALPFADFHQQRDRRVDVGVLKSLLQKEKGEQPRVFTVFRNTARYAPICYMPQAIGIAVARSCGASALGTMYAGRLAALLFWVAAVYACIRISPVLKWAFALVGLLPMSAYIGSSLSADMVTNACAMLLAAWVLREALTPGRPVGIASRIAIVVLCVAVSIAKQAYFPLVAIVLIIPHEKLGGARGKAWFCIVAIAAGLAVNVAWWAVSAHTYVPLFVSEPSAQIAFILHHPWQYAEVIGRTLVANLKWYMYSFVGALGWTDTRLPLWMYWTYPFVLVAAAIFDNGRGRPLKAWERSLVLGISLVIFFGLLTLTYVTWNRVGDEYIRDVQGRYMLPIAIPFLLLFYNRKVRPAGPLFWGATSLYAAVVLVVTCVILYGRYYV
jgi:uncharacterized membrane protein